MRRKDLQVPILSCVHRRGWVDDLNDLKPRIKTPSGDGVKCEDMENFKKFYYKYLVTV